jgi:hypothetical protein
MAQYSSLETNYQTRINDNDDEKLNYDDNNLRIHNYHTLNQSNSNLEDYHKSLDVRGMYQSSAANENHFIDEDSHLKDGSMGNILTSDKSKTSKCLDTSHFLGTPFLGRGESTLKMPDLKSRLIIGEDTSQSRSCNTLSGISIDRFTPLVPCLADNVQNTKHIVPEYWVRGGMSTRNIIRNIDYMRTCGFKK